MRKDTMAGIQAVKLWGMVVAVPVLMGIVSSPGSTRLEPQTKDDYGSGSTLHSQWYVPGGGDPQVGVFVGHPNGLPRSDRGLVRFNLSPYLLPPAREVSIKRATLTFHVEYFHGKENLRHIEISHLKYDALTFSGNDTVNQSAEVIGVIEIHRNTATAKPFFLNVTKYVKDDIWKGNKYTAFRFRDIDAETKGNVDMKPAGVIIHLNGPLPTLEIQ